MKQVAAEAMMSTNESQQVVKAGVDESQASFRLSRDFKSLHLKEPSNAHMLLFSDRDILTFI